MNKFTRLLILNLLCLSIVQSSVSAQQYPPGYQNKPYPQQIPNRQIPPVPTAPPVAQRPPARPQGVNPSQKIEQPLTAPSRPQIYYTEPGIIGYQNGRWVGSDHLYNLQANIGVYVEIVRLPDIKHYIEESVIEKNVLDQFRKAGFSAYPLTGDPNPPFPYYHVLVITMPMMEGKIGYVSCRLFEQIHLDRVQVAEGVYWQGITWEKQTLVQAPTEEFAQHIYNDISQITNDFIERFKHFEDLKNKFGQ